jgi:hypothetical protein
MSALDQVIEFVKVVASAVVGENAAVLFDVVGAGGFSSSQQAADVADDAAENAPQQPAYGPLGYIARPLPPTDLQQFAEAMAARTADGLEPFAYRDLRINRAINPTGEGNAPAPGQLGFAGYGGSYSSVRQAAVVSGSKKPDVYCTYVPYDFDGDGVPQKAHAIIVDSTPGNSSIQLVHGDGVFFTLSEETGDGPGLVAAVGNNTFLRMIAGELTLQSTKILLKGNVYLGLQAEAGLPLLAGPASPPGPSVFISPV